MASDGPNLIPEESLKSLFEKALTSYVFLTEDYKSPTLHQALIKTTIEQLESVTRLINAAELFSSNELLDEIPTENIQYLAIPCMLGYLVGNSQSGGDRLQVLEVSEVYYKDFLKRAKEYNLVSDAYKISGDDPNGKRNLTQAAVDKNLISRKFTENKKIVDDLVKLKKNLERADEEDRRNYFILFVKSFVHLADQELRSIAMEKPMVLMRKESGADALKKKPKRPPTQPLQPVIIVKNELQKQVFGLGYPSRPTMTVDEFYEERVREGIFPSGPSKYANSLQMREDPEVSKAMDEEEDVKNELLEEADDPDELEKQRQMDDFKDEHRRGYGNRHNRS